MSNEPNKPIPAQELTEKELEGVNGGGTPTPSPYGIEVSAEYGFVYSKSKGQE